MAGDPRQFELLLGSFELGQNSTVTLPAVFLQRFGLWVRPFSEIGLPACNTSLDIPATGSTYFGIVQGTTHDLVMTGREEIRVPRTSQLYSASIIFLHFRLHCMVGYTDVMTERNG